MMRQNRSLLEVAVTWQREHEEELAEACVGTRVLGPTVGQSKDLVSVEFVSLGQLASVTIWDSGECEVIQAPTDAENDSDPVVEVYHLTDSSAALILLDRVGSNLSETSG